MIAASAQRFGDHLAVDDGERRFSYAELYQEARSFGAALVASGIEPGDRVALWAFNSAQWVVALLGLFQAGAVLVPINTRFKGGEAAEILAAESRSCPGDGHRLPRHRLRRDAALHGDGASRSHDSRGGQRPGVGRGRILGCIHRTGHRGRPQTCR